MNELTLTNARVVLRDEVVEGTVHARDGRIAGISEGRSNGSHAHANGAAIDLDGDYLVPGLVELHTDHIETHYMPRPGVRWDPHLAAQAHDAQIAGSGITTVFDALCLGMEEERLDAAELRALIRAVQESQERGLMRAQHFTHLRCEVSSPVVVDQWAAFADEPSVRLASLMDHTPGQRQFVTLDQHRLYYQGSKGLSEEEYQDFLAERVERAERYSDAHRRAISSDAKARSIAIASHDDATREHVAEAVRDGVSLAEFPTTVEAAEASRASGITVMMGAPNVVRGKSHSGNVAALDLARRGALDMLSSDYVPYSLMQAAFLLPERTARMADETGEGEAWDLPRAIRAVSLAAAEAAGLHDRGVIEEGRRADLVRVRVDEGRPVVREVWREGVRVS